MAAITTLYADSSAGALTTTSSTFSAVCTIDASLIEGDAVYIVLAYGKSKMDVDDATSRGEFMVAANGSIIDGGTSPNHTLSARQAQGTTGMAQAAFLYKYTAPSTPVDITLEARNIDGADTLVAHGALIMFKLSDFGTENTDWFYAEKTTTDSSSGVYKNRETITFTPAAEDDYLCITLAKWNATNTTFSCLGQIVLDDATVESSYIAEPELTAEHQTWMMATVNTLDATEHNFKQRVASESAAVGNDTDWSSMFVLRLGALDDASWTDSQTEVDPSVDGWQDIITVAHTPALASDQFVLAAVVKDHNSGGTPSSRITVDDSSVTVGDTDPLAGVGEDVSDEIPLALFGVLEDWDGALTAAYEYDPNGAADAARIEDNTIVAFGPLALNGGSGPVSGGDSAIPSLSLPGTRIPSVGGN